MRNDQAYANSAFIPGGADYPARWAASAKAVRIREAAIGRARLDQAYGDHPRQRFDLFYPEDRPRGLVVLFHGGYWLHFGREDFSHLARGCTAAGWAVALPSYRLAPEVDLPRITADAAKALTAAAAVVEGPIAVTGHSAGGHLAARMLCRDAPHAVQDRIVTCVPVSPLSDLRPLLETSMNDLLGLNESTAAVESPVLCTDRVAARATVWVGAMERPAFLEQARRLADAWTPAALHVEPDRHHFDVIEAYEDRDSHLVRLLTGHS